MKYPKVKDLIAGTSTELTGNPATSYAAWCAQLSSEGARTGKRVAYGPETYAAWVTGKTPRQYVDSLPGWGPKGNPSDDDRNVADVVLRAAMDTPPWAGNKKFIASVYDTIVEQGRDDGMSLAEFKDVVYALYQKDLIKLTRADLVAAMPDRDVRRSEIDRGVATFHFIIAGPRANPSPLAEDATAARDKYKEFHRYDPKDVTEIDIVIPRRVRKLGPAAHVLYRSGKVDPATLKKPKRPVDYIHEHDAGVVAYACDGRADTDVPAEFVETTALTVLGKSLGFALKDGTEAEGTEPLPELCCVPSGKCLLIVQDRRKVLFMIWGGALGVYARGIDG